jgi:cardiolipin synthase
MAFFLFDNQLIPAIAIYITASITDVIDGLIARKFNMITTLGKILDPMADKLLQFTALIGLWYIDIIPFWITAIFFAKEILMGLGCIKLLKKDIVIQSKWFGKASTCMFFLAIVVSMLSVYYKALKPYPINLMCFALLMALFSLIMYLMNYIKIKRINNSRT